MDTTARILLHIFTAAAGFIQFVNGKWGQASREVLAWNDSFGFQRIGTSPPWATTLLLHKGRRATTFAPSRVRRDDCRLQRFFCRGGPPVTVVYFFLDISFPSSSSSGAFPCPRMFCGVWEFSPLSDTNYLRLLAAAAANAMLTTVDGGEHL
jgi:hypothetical protein